MEMTHIRGTLGPPPAAMAPAAPADATGIRLADLATGERAWVVSIAGDTRDSPALGRRLAELGFLPGEMLRIVARGLMGREPLAVRIGTGTFALRLFEAECIRVSLEQSLQA